MAMIISTLLVLVLGAVVLGQRPSFAGSKPIGYPELYDITTTTQTNTLGNRFGEGDGTTQRLPLEANGDRDLVNRLSKLPVDKQPFWFINWQALEEHRRKPQTYPLRPSSFNIQSENGNKPVSELVYSLANRNSNPEITRIPASGYHYPGIFPTGKVDHSIANDRGYSNFNVGALSLPITTNRPHVPSRSTNLKSGIENSDYKVRDTSSSGNFSATKSFRNWDSVFSNYSSVLKSTDNIDPQGNTVFVQTSGAPGPNAAFQLTSDGVLVPNPAVINASVPNAPNISSMAFDTKYATSQLPGTNSSVVQSNASFHNSNNEGKNATHYHSSYHNNYTYSYNYKYVIPHGGGPPEQSSV